MNTEIRIVMFLSLLVLRWSVDPRLKLSQLQEGTIYGLFKSEKNQRFNKNGTDVDFQMKKNVFKNVLLKKI